MLSLLYWIYTLALAGLTVFTLRSWPRQNRAYWMVLLFVLLGLIYDNLILALGSLLGEGGLLLGLSYGRFVAHAFGTPILTIFSFGLLRRAGVPWAQGWRGHALACFFTTILIGIGIYEEIFHLRLELAPIGDLVRYTNTVHKGPPLPPILTIVAMFALGVFLWRATGWSWLAWGALFMFVAAALGTRDRLFLSNLGEVVLALACCLSAVKFLAPATQPST